MKYRKVEYAIQVISPLRGTWYVSNKTFYPETFFATKKLEKAATDHSRSKQHEKAKALLAKKYMTYRGEDIELPIPLALKVIKIVTEVTITDDK